MVCDTGVSVLGSLLDEHDLRGLASELQEADRGSDAAETRSDDHDPTEPVKA